MNKTAAKTDSYMLVKDMAKRFLNQNSMGRFAGKLIGTTDHTLPR